MKEEVILRKTHYGLNIYVYILKQYDPGVLLAVSGNKCQPTLNPFLQTDRTLKIEILKGMAHHQDIVSKEFRGTVFDFAKRYFKTNTKEELFTQIDSCLHLGIQTESKTINRNNDQERLDRLLSAMPDSKGWSPRFSYFKAPIQNVNPLRTVSLQSIYKIITDTKRKEATEAFRSMKDPKRKKQYKSKIFDYATFSGVFAKRNEKALIKHSSLITIDFDHLEDVTQTKRVLLQDQYFDTELLFTSPSGNGLKWVVKIDLTGYSHQEYFKAIASYIKKQYQITIDHSGKDVSRACYLPYDKDAFINLKHQSI